MKAPPIPRSFTARAGLAAALKKQTEDLEAASAKRRENATLRASQLKARDDAHRAADVKYLGEQNVLFRVFLGLFRKPVTAFAMSVITGAYSRNMITEETMRVLIAIVDRRLYPEQNETGPSSEPISETIGEAEGLTP